MKKYIYPALLSNAASLGVHWIYDHKFLEALSLKQSLLFLSQEKQLYDQANPSYFVYPNSNVGDLSVQGDMLKWLYQITLANQPFTLENYKKLLVDKFIPGGNYQGYVETYAKKLIVSELSSQLDIKISLIELNDHHLVGFIPYLVAKEFDFTSDQAWSLTQLFTNNKDYLVYFRMFDLLFDLLDTMDIKKAITNVIDDSPKDMKNILKKAIEIKETNNFIKEYAGRACEIGQAIPVIIHILYHTSSFEQALSLNAMIGGASSDRALLIGAILAQVYDIPKEWIEKVNIKL